MILKSYGYYISKQSTASELKSDGSSYNMSIYKHLNHTVKGKMQEAYPTRDEICLFLCDQLRYDKKVQD